MPFTAIFCSSPCQPMPMPHQHHHHCSFPFIPAPFNAVFCSSPCHLLLNATPPPPLLFSHPRAIYCCFLFIPVPFTPQCHTTTTTALFCSSPLTSVQMIVLNFLASPLMMPVTARVPYRYHLVSAAANVAGTLLALAGVLGNDPGICRALYARPDASCSTMRHVLDRAWLSMQPYHPLLQRMLGLHLALHSRVGCIAVILTWHMAASLLMTCVMYYVELRSRLEWLLQQHDPRTHSAALALWHSGGLLLAWTWSNLLSLSTVAIVCLLAVLATVVS